MYVGALDPTCWLRMHLNKKTRMRELNLQDQQRLSLVGIRFASEKWSKRANADEE